MICSNFNIIKGINKRFLLTLQNGLTENISKHADSGTESDAKNNL